MNKCIIIGNMVYAPVLRYVETAAGQVAVCELNVAVNRGYGEREQTDYFRATVWRAQAEACARYLDKGSKVCVEGPVTVRAYQRNDGSAGASLEMQAERVEFLTTRQEGIPR